MRNYHAYYLVGMFLIVVSILASPAWLQFLAIAYGLAIVIIGAVEQWSRGE